jgi:hypothetical protein
MIDSQLKEDMERFFATYLGASTPSPWEDVFTAKQVEDAVDGLIGILAAAGSPKFSLPDEATLLSLIRMVRDEIPPCGSDLSGSPEPKNTAVDFRHILMAGWIVSEQPSIGTENLDFLTLNKLCEMGMLQQRAIDLYNAGRTEAA